MTIASQPNLTKRMKVLSADQIRALDKYTIKHEPIASIDLMERASKTFVQWFTGKFTSLQKPVFIFCGPGNNGGDGLAIARLLHFQSYEIKVFLCKISDQLSADNQENLKWLPRFESITVEELPEGAPMPGLPDDCLVIDAIFGSGLNRSVEGYWAKLLEWLNKQKVTRIAVDIPSGMFADNMTEGTSLSAHYTFSFELPKLAFFFPENQDRLGHWLVQSIGLHPEKIRQSDTNHYYLTSEMAKGLIRYRPKYGHKGTFGHALLIMGSYGKMGAAILATTACLRSGVGLASVHIPKCGYEIMQISVPEAMASVDIHKYYVSDIPVLKHYDAIAIGCGLDQKESSIQAIQVLLGKAKKPLIIDADAINILGQHPEWHKYIPRGSILTPHPKEFERMFGSSDHQLQRLELQRKKAKELQVVIVLKGAHTSIVTPDGDCFFNSTGNPGMGTGGSGDVLTGIITGLLAQGYSSEEAAILGVYVHGLAGDLAAEELEHESLIARDLVDYLGKAFKHLHQSAGVSSS